MVVIKGDNRGKEDMLVEIEIIEMIVVMKNEKDHRADRIQENSLKKEVIQEVKVMVEDIREKGSLSKIILVGRLSIIKGRIIRIIMEVWIIRDSNIIMDRITQVKELINRENNNNNYNNRIHKIIKR